MGYRLNRLDESVFIAVSKPLLTEIGIHHRLESCVVSFLLPQCSKEVGDRFVRRVGDETWLETDPVQLGRLHASGLRHKLRRDTAPTSTPTAEYEGSTSRTGRHDP